MQRSEQSALERAAGGESSSRLLVHQAPQLPDSRDAAVALHHQLVQASQQARDLAEVRLCGISCGACADQMLAHL